MVQVRATDRDIGINSVLSYYITAGNDDMTFRMDRISGEISTRPAPPDREHQSFYHLVVTVEDEGTPPLSVSDRGGHGTRRVGEGQLRLLCEGNTLGGNGAPCLRESRQRPHRAFSRSAYEYAGEACRSEGLCLVVLAHTALWEGTS